MPVGVCDHDFGNMMARFVGASLFRAAMTIDVLLNNTLPAGGINAKESSYSDTVIRLPLSATIMYGN